MEKTWAAVPSNAVNLYCTGEEEPRARVQTRFSDPILKTSAEYHASSTYGPEILHSGCTGGQRGQVHGTVHHQLEIVGLVKSMTVQEI